MMPMSIAMSDPTGLIGDVSAFSEAAQGVADLHLHGEVEKTVDSLLAYRKFMHGHARTGRGIIERIRSGEVEEGGFMDPSDTLIDELEIMINRDEAHLSQMVAKKKSIDADDRLNASHCDMLHSAYDDYLGALACLIEVFREMREAIIDHDLAAEPRGKKVYRDLKSLKAALVA